MKLFVLCHKTEMNKEREDSKYYLKDDFELIENFNLIIN